MLEAQQQLEQLRPLQGLQDQYQQQQQDQQQQEQIVYHLSMWKQQKQQLIAEEDVYYPPPPPWQQQEPQQQQVPYQHWLQQHNHHHQQQHGDEQEPDLAQSEQQQQQQQSDAAPMFKVSGPRDLSPEAAAAFESALPVGLLPDKWRSLPKWGAFEMECKFTVVGTDKVAIQELRTRFKQAKEAAVAATQAQRQQQQQQQGQQDLGSHMNHQAAHVSSRSNGVIPQVQPPSVSLPAMTTAQGAAALASEPRAEASDSYGSKGSSSGRGRSRSKTPAPHFRAAQVRLHRRPCDIPQQLREQFAASFPPGVLPEFWMTFQSWEQLAAKLNADAFGPPSEQRAKNLELALSSAVSDILDAVDESELQLQLDQQQREERREQRRAERQQRPGPCDLSGDLADRFAAALPEPLLPHDWQQYTKWCELCEKVTALGHKNRMKRADVKQLFKEARDSVMQEYASSAGEQQHSDQQQTAEQYSTLANSSVECDGSGAYGQRQELDQQQQQQSGHRHTTIRPCDFPPAFASQFAAAVPEGVLPEDWQQCESWRSLENLLSLPGAKLKVMKQVREAKFLACGAYEDWIKQQHQQPPAVQNSNSSSTHTAHHQPGPKRTVAPRDLPAEAAALLESLVPAGVLPGNWQEYPTWPDLDVAVCHTAGGTDQPAVMDSVRRFKEAKQAALAAAAAAGAPTAADDHTGTDGPLQQQGTGSRPGTSSAASAATGTSSSRSATGGSSAVPPAAAPAPPSVSWAQAATGSSQNPAAASPANTARAETPVKTVKVSGSATAAHVKQPLNRHSSGDVGSATPKRSNAVAISNSRLGSSSMAAAAGSSTPRRDLPAAAAAKAPPNSKYIPAGDPVCFNCGARGHPGQQCNTPYCASCTQWGHAEGRDCLSACHHCGKIHSGAGYVRCSEPSCDKCNLMGHKWFECPHTMCSTCNCYGHTSRDCRSCRECRIWGHSAEECPGFCRKCNAPGHKTADCTVKRCVQCGKAGCVVGMCSGFAAGNNSSSRTGGVRGSSRAAASSTAAAAAATAGLFDPAEVTFDVPDSAEQEQQRRESLVSKLMEIPKLEQYACALLTETAEAVEKWAVLAKVSAADLSFILQQQNPAELLDQIYSMQSAAAAASKPDPAAAAAGRVSGADQQSGSSQQEGATVLMPCDLQPQHRQIFEDCLPVDSLPEDWFDYGKWIDLERQFIEYFKSTSVSVRLQDRRVVFRRARQYVQGVAAGTITPEQPQQQSARIQSPQQHRNRDQQQSQQQEYSGSGSEHRRPTSQQGWPQQQQQRMEGPASRDSWPVVEQDQHGEVASSDGWPVTEQPQQAAPKESAWARKLNLMQPEAQQQQQQQQAEDGDQQQQQDPVQGDQGDPSAEPWHEQEDQYQSKAVLAPVQIAATAPTAQQLPHDLQGDQHQFEEQQHAAAIPAHAAQPPAAPVAAAAGVPVISQPFPMHLHHQQLHPMQPGMAPQQQQQPVPVAAAKVLGPRDLSPAAAAAFEASLPPGLLPDNWRSLPKWGAFEMECKFTVVGTDPEVIQELRTRFKAAKEAAKAHTQAERAEPVQPPWQQQQQQQQQMPRQQQQGQMVRGPPPGFVHPPASTAVVTTAMVSTGMVAPSPIYVVGHQALQQQQQQRVEPAVGIPVGMYPPAYPAAVALSAAPATVPVHLGHLMPHPAMMAQYAAMQHYGSPGQHILAGVPAAEIHAVPASMPHAMAVVQPRMAGTYGPPGAVAAAAAATAGGSDDEELSDMLSLLGAQGG